jgi:hypothetical protein
VKENKLEERKKDLKLWLLKAMMKKKMVIIAQKEKFQRKENKKS